VDSSFYLSNLTPNLRHPSLTAIAGAVQMRHLAPHDVVAVADLIGDSFGIGAAFGRWFRPLFKMGIREDLRSRWQDRENENSICWVATIPNHPHPIVGTVEVSSRSTLNTALNKRYAYISNLAVEREYRGLGIGRQLIDRCEGVAKQWGFSFIYLHVMAENQSALHLYAKLGFETIGRDRTWHLLPWKRAHRLFLRKPL
jgi:ribosomal protein S18 acetylase RimI-like enzyme